MKYNKRGRNTHKSLGCSNRCTTGFGSIELVDLADNAGFCIEMDGDEWINERGLRLLFCVGSDIDLHLDVQKCFSHVNCFRWG